MSNNELAKNITTWAKDLGFQAVGISGIDLSEAEDRLIKWLDKGRHGDMDWMQRHPFSGLKSRLRLALTAPPLKRLPYEA